VRRRELAALALIFTAYFGLGIATMFTRAPWQDEAWFGSPAYNLAHRGFLGTTILDPASSTWKSVKLSGIDRHTYWVMPLSLLLNAADFRIFGFGSIQMRAPSLLFGAAFLLAWRTILRRLGAPFEVVLAALLLIAVDFHFQMQAADGRMDAMTAALGYGAIAAYLILRERGLVKAVAVSHALAAAACFTHPNGALLALLLICTMLYLDGQPLPAGQPAAESHWKLRQSAPRESAAPVSGERLGFAAMAAAVVPYLAIGGAWAVYIAQAPADFNAQFAGNAADRGPMITEPLAALQLEITHRYIDNFGLASWFSTAGRLNVATLVILLAGTLACFCIGGIRRHPGYRMILMWTAITIVYLTWFEGLKTRFYLIYLTPLYSVLCAVAAYWLWTRRPRWRPVVVATLAILIVLQAGRTAVVAYRNPKAASFTPAARYLQEHFDRKTFIMGDGSLMFGVGPDWNVLDDFRLGYNSGKIPDVVVIDESWADRIAELRTEHPEIWEHVQRVLGGCREVYNERGYRVLVRLHIEPRP
jgi:hypothetical protein